MKKLYLLFAMLFAALFSLAQEDNCRLENYPESSSQNSEKTTRAWVPLASNFVLQDLDGVVHNLQQYRDDGKYVVVDLSITGCGACWSLHQSGVFEDLHNTYGPPGTNEMVVLWAEIDGSTDIDDIEGNTAATMGDWTNGGTFPVPIIDDYGAAQPFDSLFSGGVPKVYLVCPSGDYKDVTSQAQSGATAVYDETSSCPIVLNAMFEASETTILPGDCIYYQDQSTGPPTSWDWTFDGANTTSSSAQNPNNICYDIPGTYDVTLAVEDADGDMDTLVKPDYITVLDSSFMPAALFTSDRRTVPVGGVVTFTDTSVNGPFVNYAWDFEGGNPSTSTDSQPAPVIYTDPGYYDVELRIEDTDGEQYVNLKEDYIHVVPPADDPPVADFIANYTVIQPGESIDFQDISSNHPYEWEWEFEAGLSNQLTAQNPQGVTYPAEGEFDVTMIAKNSEGNDTITKENYIVVSTDDPCTQDPIADFRATNRLLSAGETTYFQDLSDEYPASHYWNFDGGIPGAATTANPMNGVQYNIPNIYDVSLLVNNGCGNDDMVKENYIYVFSGSIPKYCDTMTNIKDNENPTTINAGQWGFLAGHNSERVRYYADYFETYSFTQIESLVVPVVNSVNGSYNSYVTFHVWSDEAELPNDSTSIAEKKVYLRDIPGNYNYVVNFDNPVEIDGPFYVGFKISYPDNDNNGISDDDFVVSVAPSRGTSASDNTLYVYEGGEWKSSVQAFGISTSLAIKPKACLVDIDEFDIYSDVHAYPNPTSGQITIELGDEYRNKEIDIKVFDLTGRMLMMDKKQYSQTEYSLDFSNQTPGMYYLNINVDGEKITKKISVMK